MMLMIILVGIIGLVFGSFAGATVWRLRARQLQADDLRLRHLKAKKTPTKSDKQELAELRHEKAERKTERKKLDSLLKPIKDDRSQCLHCKHTLRWYDLVPLVSWLSTRGRCRYCQHPIGYFEPLIEVGAALGFVTMFLYWQTLVAPIWLLAVLLGIMVLLVVLFTYDTKWFLLPDSVVWPFAALSLVIATYSVGTSENLAFELWSVAGAILILSGLYLALWLVSRGAWVGFGDVKLGLGLALLLADWRLAFMALFLANLIGMILVLPGMVMGRLTRTSHIPFGPLLIGGSLIALWGAPWLLWVWQTLIFTSVV